MIDLKVSIEALLKKTSPPKLKLKPNSNKSTEKSTEREKTSPLLETKPPPPNPKKNLPLPSKKKD